MKKLMTLMFLFAIFRVEAQNAAFQIYNSEGKVVSFEKMLKGLENADFIFFGEYHNNPISHWMELKLTEALFDNMSNKLTLGAEMFERDDQIVLDEYLDSLIDVKNFEQEAKLWKNYKTDYKPLVEFAKKNHLKFIATNVPRRYAARVNKFGGLSALDALSPQAKKYLPPLPIKFYSKIYIPIFQAMGIHGFKKEKSNSLTDGDPLRDMAEAQALKDATMAYFLYANWTKGQHILHFNGSMHSDKHQGIISYLVAENKKLEIKTLTTVQQKDIYHLNDKAKNKADFIICVPLDMTTTY